MLIIIIIIVVIWLFVEKDNADINVALNKSSSFCDIMNLSAIITDGFMDASVAERITDSCPDRGNKAFVEVHLSAHYYIHFVLVYEGNGGAAGTLNNFMAELGTEYRNQRPEPCSRYTKPSAPNVTMRVNCKVGSFSRVRVVSSKNEGFSISEIKIISLATGVPDENVRMLYGCYSKFIKQHEFKVDKVAKCFKQCVYELYPLAAVKEDLTCHCGNADVGHVEVALGYCGHKCDNYFCGGTDLFSVYLVSFQLPYSIGCLMVTEDLMNEKIRGDMTFEKCFIHCRNYQYAGLKNGDQCFCTNEYTEANYEHYNECNLKCFSDANSFCGGEIHSSVYQIQTLRQKTHDLLKCGNFNEFGVCNDKCRDGFVGENCLEKSLTVDCKNYDPCLADTDKYCVLLQDNNYECRYVGFMKKHLFIILIVTFLTVLVCAAIWGFFRMKRGDSPSIANTIDSF